MITYNGLHIMNLESFLAHFHKIILFIAIYYISRLECLCKRLKYLCHNLVKITWRIKLSKRFLYLICDKLFIFSRFLRNYSYFENFGKIF